MSEKKKHFIYDDISDFLAWVVEAIEFTPMNEGAKHILIVLIDIQRSQNNKQDTSNLQRDRTAY